MSKLTKFRNKVFHILGVIMLVTGLFASISTINAATVNMTGNTANDVKITDDNGKPVNPDQANVWTAYNADWTFSIPNDAQINNGDTATFSLPTGIVANGTLSFPVTNQQGQTIGTFTIQKNSSTGTLTFNNYYHDHPEINRQGHIHITVNGSNNSKPGNNDWNINKVAWVDNQGHIIWNIAINAGFGYDSVTIKDTASQGQTILPATVKAEQGYYDASGIFVPQKTVPVTTIANGNQATLKLGSIQGIVNITYQTKSNHNGELSNKAQLIPGSGPQNNQTTSNRYEDSAQVAYNGNGNATGSIVPPATTSSSSSSSSSNSSSIVTPSSSSVASSSSSSSSLSHSSSMSSSSSSSSNSSSSSSLSNNSSTSSSSSSSKSSPSSNSSSSKSKSSSSSSSKSSNSSSLSLSSSSMSKSSSSKSSSSSMMTPSSNSSSNSLSSTSNSVSSSSKHTPMSSSSNSTIKPSSSSTSVHPGHKVEKPSSSSSMMIPTSNSCSSVVSTSSTHSNTTMIHHNSSSVANLMHNSAKPDSTSTNTSSKYEVKQATNATTSSTIKSSSSQSTTKATNAIVINDQSSSMINQTVTPNGNNHEKHQSSSNNSQNTLPQTGEANGLLLIMISAICISIATVWYKFNKQHN